MDSKSVKIKPHFLYIFTLLYPYLTLLIIPVLKETVSFVLGKSTSVSELFAAELALLSAAVTLALLKYRRTVLIFGDEITVKKGLFCRMSYTLPKGTARVVVLESNPLLRPLGVFKLKIYTEGGVRKRADENLPIGRKTAEKLYKMLAVDGQAVRSNTFGNVLMSAALSSSVAGWLLAMPIVKIVGNLAGDGLTKRLYNLKNADEIAEISLYFGKFLPLVLLLGYIISFFVLLLKNSGFQSVKSGKKIMLSSGRLPYRTLFLKADCVRATKAVTAPLMLLADKCAVKFSACGFGRAKGEIGLLVPCVKPTIAKGLLQWLLPHLDSTGSGIRPPKAARKRALFLPLLLLALCIAAAYAGALLLPRFEKILYSVALVQSFVLLLYTAVRLTAVRVGRFSAANGSVNVKYRQGFKIAELTADRKSVGQIRVLTTPFDRKHGQCSVKIRLLGKNRDCAKLKFLDKHQADSEVKGLL